MKTINSINFFPNKDIYTLANFYSCFVHCTSLLSRNPYITQVSGKSLCSFPKQMFAILLGYCFQINNLLKNFQGLIPNIFLKAHKSEFKSWQLSYPCQTVIDFFPLISYFFQRFTEKQPAKIAKDLEQTSKEDKKAKILCKICLHQVTSPTDKFAVNGVHQHTFSNPSGITYKIGCFSKANGCVNQGFPIQEHTWFKGYSWRFALCGNCYVHLGWFYQLENDSFYGLILDNLLQNCS